MSATNVWTNDRVKARPNEYDGLCKSCMDGNKPVIKLTGYLVSSMLTSGSAGSNGAIHATCPVPEGWYLRSKFGHSGMLPSEVKACPDIRNKATEQPEANDTTVETPKEPEPPREPTQAELEAVAAKLLKDNTDAFMKAVPDLVRKTMHEATRTVEIKIVKAKPVTVKNAHKILPKIVMAMQAGVKPMLVGPAGSGKSTVLEQVAEVLGRKFYMANSVAGKHELLGFRDAHGKPVHQDFYVAYKNGGLFLLDEMDNSNPNALVALNAALSNGFCDFAGEIVRMHKNFLCCAATNTWGRGADMMYVGRNKLDGASLDRFATFFMDYDEDAELLWAGNDEWTKYVQAVRKVVFAEKINHIVSTRASIEGAKLLAIGMERGDVEESCLWKGLDATHRARITSRMNMESQS